MIDYRAGPEKNWQTYRRIYDIIGIRNQIKILTIKSRKTIFEKKIPSDIKCNPKAF